MDPVLQQWRSAISPLTSRPPTDPPSCPPFGWARMPPLFGTTPWSTPALVGLFAAARAHGATPLHAGNIRLVADVLAEAESRADEKTFYTALHLLYAVPGDWAPRAALDDDMGVAPTVHEVMGTFDRLLHGTFLSPAERRRLAHKHLALLEWMVEYRRADIARDADGDAGADGGANHETETEPSPPSHPYPYSYSYSPQSAAGYRGAHTRLRDALGDEHEHEGMPACPVRNLNHTARYSPEQARERWEYKYTYVPPERYPETSPSGSGGRGRDYGPRYLPPLPNVAPLPLRPLSRYAVSSSSGSGSSGSGASVRRASADVRQESGDSSRGFSFVPYEMSGRVSREVESEHGHGGYEMAGLSGRAANENEYECGYDHVGNEYNGLEHQNRHEKNDHYLENEYEYEKHQNDHEHEHESDHERDRQPGAANSTAHTSETDEYPAELDEPICDCDDCLRDLAVWDSPMANKTRARQARAEEDEVGYMAGDERSPPGKARKARKARNRKPQLANKHSRSEEFCDNDDAPRYKDYRAETPPQSARYFEQLSPDTPSAISSLAVHATPDAKGALRAARTPAPAPAYEPAQEPTTPVPHATTAPAVSPSPAPATLASPFTSPRASLPGRAVPRDAFVALRAQRGQSVSPTLAPARRLADRRARNGRSALPHLELALAPALAPAPAPARPQALTLPPLVDAPPSPLRFPPSTRRNPYTTNPRTPPRRTQASPSWCPPSHGPGGWRSPSRSPACASPPPRASPHASPANSPGAVRKAAMEAVIAHAAAARVQAWRAERVEYAYEDRTYSATEATETTETPRHGPSPVRKRSPAPACEAREAREAARPYTRLRPGRRWKPRPSEYAPWSSESDVSETNAGVYQPWSPPALA